MTIKPEEIVEGDRLTLEAEVVEIGDDATIHVSFGDRTVRWFTREALAAATITRHQREPQVGDVGTWCDNEYEVVAGPRERPGYGNEVAIWSKSSGFYHCLVSDFTVTKRAGQ